jgi:hypothetical protein
MRCLREILMTGFSFMTEEGCCENRGSAEGLLYMRYLKVLLMRR